MSIVCWMSPILVFFLSSYSVLHRSLFSSTSILILTSVTYVTNRRRTLMLSMYIVKIVHLYLYMVKVQNKQLTHIIVGLIMMRAKYRLFCLILQRISIALSSYVAVFSRMLTNIITSMFIHCQS